MIVRLGIILCAGLILASCSSTDRPRVVGPDAVPCAVPHEKPPKDGGIGGTGVREDHCR